MPKKTAPKPRARKATVVKPRKRARSVARYTALGQIVCGTCYSRPNVRMRVEMDLAGKFGYAMRHLSDPLVLPTGRSLKVQVQLVPCGNPDCFSDVVVYNEAGKPGPEGHPILRDAYRLQSTEQSRFDSGVTDRTGIWRTIGPES